MNYNNNIILQASRLGAEAALTVLEANEESEASVICLCGQQIVKKPLHECVSMVSCIIYLIMCFFKRTNHLLRT